MCIQRNIETSSRNNCSRGKAINITYLSVCARVKACVRVEWLMHHATRIRYVVTSFVAPLAPQYFSTLSHKRNDFRKKVTKYKMRVLIFSTNYI